MPRSPGDRTDRGRSPGKARTASSEAIPATTGGPRVIKGRG
jgi:hypothetical protein